MAFVLGPRAAELIRQLLNETEGPTNLPARGGMKSRLPIIVRCTSTTPADETDAGEQCFPAVVLNLNSADDTHDGTANVWLTLLDGTGFATPVVGVDYIGLVAGSYDPDPDGDSDPRPRVFAVGGGTCGEGCGWVSGLLSTWCLAFSVLQAEGECSDIDTEQSGEMRWVTDSWFLQEWDEEAIPPAWVNLDFTYGGGSGPVEFWVDADGPHLSIDEIELIRDCCANGTAQFSGGSVLGLCDGTPPVTPCADNTFRVKVECQCCSIDGWDGPGWYCVEDDEEVCSVAIELLEEDRCDTDIVICSGPYETEEDAEIGCGAIVTACCPDDPFPDAMELVFSNDATTDLTCLNSLTVPLTWDAGAGSSGAWVSANFTNSDCTSPFSGTGPITCNDAGSVSRDDWYVMVYCVFGEYHVNIQRCVGTSSSEDMILAEQLASKDCPNATATGVLSSNVPASTDTITATFQPA